MRSLRNASVGRLAVGFVIATGSVQATRAQICVLNERHKLNASDPGNGDQFGWAVSNSANVVLIGTRYQDCADGVHCGAAYLYRFDGLNWLQEAKFTAFDATAHAEFGFSVSVDGNVVVVGARRDGNNGGAIPTGPGAAYVFRFDGSNWLFESKLAPADAGFGDEFGVSVSVDGDAVLIGADSDDDRGTNAGSAYVYRFNGLAWEEETELHASDAAAHDVFGSSVSLSGDVAIVGAKFDDDHGSHSGSAYLFRFNGTEWVEEGKVTAADGEPLDEFGSSVSVSGDVAVVGAWQDDDACPSNPTCQSGAAYVFRFNGGTWRQEKKLAASDAATEDRFGFSVSVDGDVALIGARQYAEDFQVPALDLGPGVAYVYRFNGMDWLEREKLAATDGARVDLFGHAVSVSGERALIGVPWDDDVWVTSGSAYVFDVDDPCPWCGNGEILGFEECDDANVDDGDGCSSTCVVERGFRCMGQPSRCVPVLPSASLGSVVVLALVLLVGIAVRFGRCEPVTGMRGERGG